MENTGKKLVHEEFEIKKDEQSKVTVEIRQDRHVATDEDCWMEIDGKKYEVINFSYFGIGFTSVVEFQAESKILGAKFYYDGRNYGSFDLEVRRCGPSDNVKAKYFIGAETSVATLPVDQILNFRKVRQALDELDQYDEYLNRLNPLFKGAVFKVKNFLGKLEEKMNSFEAEVFYQEKDRLEFQEVASEAVKEYLAKYFHPLYEELAAVTKDLEKDEIMDYYSFFREELKDYLYQAPFAHRSYYKPLGYAGDYEMMNIIYNNENVGKTLFAKCLHSYFVDHPNARAVRNRREYLSEFLLKEIGRKKGKIKVLSVASGPAKEVQMFFKTFDQEKLDQMELTLIDQDVFSLKHAQREINKTKLETGKNLEVKYCNYSIKNVITGGLTEKYDVIYSAGLFDYFSDPVARSAAKQLYNGLNDGGVVNIGNFCFNPNSAALMMFVLDWYLIYRDSSVLEKLYSGIASDLVVESEPEGVNLFALLRK